MKIRKATMADLDVVVDILRDGRNQLAERGDVLVPTQLGEIVLLHRCCGDDEISFLIHRLLIHERLEAALEVRILPVSFRDVSEWTHHVWNAHLA